MYPPAVKVSCLVLLICNACELSLQQYTTTMGQPCVVKWPLHGKIRHDAREVPDSRTVPQGAVVDLICDSGYFVSGGAASSACIESGWEVPLGICAEVPDDYAVCGYQATLFKNRFSDVNLGGAVQKGEYPWLAKLQIEFRGAGGSILCGGVLVSREWILTSATCITRGSSINGVLVELGGTNYAVYDDAENRIRAIPSSAVVHPKFQRQADGSVRYDFALLKLEESVRRFSPYIRPICLPDDPTDLCETQDDIARSGSKIQCTNFYSAGWAALDGMVAPSSAVSAPLKMALNVPTQPQSSCSAPVNTSQTAAFCAYSNKPDVCFETPGVPLMCLKDDRYYVVGVFSSNPSRQCGAATRGQPDIFGRVCEVFYWVRLTIGATMTTTTILTPRHTGQTNTPRGRTTRRRPPTTTPLDCFATNFVRELGEASAAGNIGKIQKLLGNGANVNAIGYPDNFYPKPCPYDWHWPNATALIWAAGCNRSVDVLRALIYGGANVRAQDYYGMNAIIAAAYHGNTPSVRFLLDRGAGVNSQNNAGETPLNEAAFFGHLETVKLLIQRGANVNSRTATGTTPLMEAASNDQLETVKYLLERGADISARNIDGYTALILAVTNDHPEMLRLLIERGGDVNAKTSTGWTALKFAEQEGYTEIIQILLDSGALPNDCTHPLCKPLKPCPTCGIF